MRIQLIQLLDYLFPFGGAHRANRVLMEKLAARGHDCQVIAPGYEAVKPRPDERDHLLEALAGVRIPVLAETEDFVVYCHHGVEVHAIVSEFSLGTYSRFYSYLAERIRGFAPDWIVVSEDHTGLFLGAALELAADRVVYLSHAQTTLPFGPEAFDQDPAKAELLGRAAGILTVSGYVKDYILHWGGLEATVIALPVYGEPPYPFQADFDHGAVTLVNASPLKGLPIFLDLASHFPATPFAAVASWGTATADREAVEALPNAALLEPRADIDEILAGTRVLLVPSLLGEAFGLIVVEAMLRGIPVLASNVGGLPEAKLGVDYVLPVAPITEYRRSSVTEKPLPVVPRQDTGPWREALAWVLGDRGHYERLSRQSRAAAETFVSGTGIHHFEAYFAALAGARAMPVRRHILMTTHGSHGDVLPFVILGRRLVQRGHRVTLLTHAFFAETARAAGLEFIPVDTEESYRRLGEDELILFNQPQDIYESTRIYLERQNVFAADLEEFRRIDALCTPETVLAGRYEDIATLLVAEKRGLPLAWVLLSPSHLATARVRDELFGESLSGPLQALRAAVGLPPVASYHDWLQTADRAVALWPAWFSAPEERGPEEVGFLLNAAIETEALAPAVEELLRREPPILISSGTTKIVQPEFFSSTLAACLRLGLPALIVTRHRELLPPELPAGAHWFPYLPFSKLLPRVRAIIHHGGIGTLAHALAAGVPQLILAAGVDRPDNARRLQKMGAAESMKLEDWTPEKVSRALGRLLDPACVAKCRQLSLDTRGADAASRACALLETLVRKPRQDGSLGDRLARLTPERRALLAMKLAGKKQEGKHEIPRLPRALGENLFPLSFAQERFWFLGKLDDDAYTVAVAPYRLLGPLRQDLLARSLAGVVERHEVFRTSFPEVDGAPVQRVSPAGKVPLDVEDLRGLDESARRPRIREIIEQEYRRGFDLEQGPLLRARLLILAAEEHVLVFTLHHMIYDGWSVGIFLEELTSLYGAHLGGFDAALPVMPIQYADYAAWQRQWLQGDRLAGLLAHWKGQLDGCAQVLALPTDRPRPRFQTFRGHHRPFALPDRLARRLRDLARAESATLFMTLLAAFDVLLYRYTMQSDLVVGVPTAGRETAETERLIGVFINMLAMRTDTDGRLSFRELLVRVRAAVLEGYEHQALPFERLVAELAPERDPSRHPLFQVIFGVERRPPEEHQFQGVVTTWYTTELRTARVDLALEIWDRPDGGITGTFEFNTDLFDESTVVRMTQHLLTLLEGLVESPHALIARLPLLAPSERAQLLPESQPPRWDLPAAGVHHLFRLWAERQPEAIAVATPEARATYRELDELAGQVGARILAAGGAGGAAGRTVALLLRNGIHHVAAMLGVLKAGGAFVCLDPDYPSARSGQIVANLGPVLLLSDRSTRSAHQALRRTLLDESGLEVEEMETVTARSGAVGPPAATGAGDPAYVAYTSGSAGQPKGILQTHGGFRYLVEWFGDHFQIAPGKRIGQWIAVGHDPCYVEIFSTLCHGGTVCIAPPEIRQDPALLRSWIGAQQIALIQMTPSLCQQILELERPESSGLAALEAVLLTGEVLPVKLAQGWRDHFGPTPALYNVYGPTESILVTTHRVEKVEPGQTAISAGAVVPGCRIFIVDANGEACPTGVAGELYVRSPFLATGYHGMPEATASAFLQNPLHAAYPDRVYRTGDLGCWRADGTLELHGRLDRQIKLRGLRVELSEIEAVLQRHEKVRECAVELQTLANGDQRLVGYVVPAGDLDAGALREWMRQELPLFMVPSAVLLLADMPRTATGKLDRGALPVAEIASARVYREPATGVERFVADLFSTHLRRERVGREDDFFELGGHSLLAARIVNRLREHYFIDAQVRDVFTHRTVAELARLVESRTGGDEGAGRRDQIARLLEQVGSLSERDAEKALAQVESG
jgi:amino acid adenylation domain-containing protein